MPAGLLGAGVAFVLFRFFDAAKPGPVAWADALFKGRRGQPIGWAQGFGILFDDLVAALCTLLVIALGVERGLCNATARMSDFDRRTLVAQLAEACASAAGCSPPPSRCTGGLIAAACTAVAGSSDWFERGFVTYSNAGQDRDARRAAGADRASTARSATRSRGRWPRARCAHSPAQLRWP